MSTTCGVCGYTTYETASPKQRATEPTCSPASGCSGHTVRSTNWPQRERTT
jgi:hypothetical protein